MRYIKIFTIGAFAVLGIAGCASNDVAEQLDNQRSLVRAETRIQEAEQSGAYEHGGAELELARDKLAEAQKAAEEGDAARADRLAMEAELDAELAQAIASNAQSQTALEEINATISTLRQELQRAE
jgi:hypothetical protein